jgi:hypothetical protein
MTKTEVVIKWVAEDVRQLRPNLTLAECDVLLDRVARHLTDRSIESGWQILESLLDIEDASA